MGRTEGRGEKGSESKGETHPLSQNPGYATDKHRTNATHRAYCRRTLISNTSAIHGPQMQTAVFRSYHNYNEHITCAHASWRVD